MKTTVSLQDSLYAWGTAILGAVPIIWTSENGPRPEAPYVSFNLTTVKSIGDDALLDEEIAGNRDFMLMTQSYGANSMDNLEKLRLSFGRIEHVLVLRAAGIVVRSLGPINDITTLLDSRYEERAQFDIGMGFAQIDALDNGRIETIHMEKNIISQDLNTITIEPITITI